MHDQVVHDQHVTAVRLSHPVATDDKGVGNELPPPLTVPERRPAPWECRHAPKLETPFLGKRALRSKIPLAGGHSAIEDARHNDHRADDSADGGHL